MHNKVTLLLNPELVNSENRASLAKNKLYELRFISDFQDASVTHA